jgi:antitoxin component YwqK of YwqJK toxin-antitoxin module
MEADFMAQQAPLRNKIWAIVFFTAAIGCNTTAIKPNSDAGFIIPVTDTDIKNGDGLLYYKNRLFTGNLFALFPTGNDTAETAYYQNGKEHGEWKKFYPAGGLKEKRKFENGIKTGALITWWPNGNRQMLYQFLNNESEGTCREWTENGMLSKEMNYANGREEGPQKCWYDNGKIKANYTIINGRRYGLLGTKNCINVSDSIFKN